MRELFEQSGWFDLNGWRDLAILWSIGVALILTVCWVGINYLHRGSEAAKRDAFWSVAKVIFLITAVFAALIAAAFFTGTPAELLYNYTGIPKAFGFALSFCVLLLAVSSAYSLIYKGMKLIEAEDHGPVLNRLPWIVFIGKRLKPPPSEFYRPATSQELAAIMLMSDEELDSLSSFQKTGCRAVAMAARGEYERRDKAEFDPVIAEDAVNIAQDRDD